MTLLLYRLISIWITHMPVGEKVAQMYRMSLFKQMIYCNTAVFRFRYESHANIGRRAVALAPKNEAHCYQN